MPTTHVVRDTGKHLMVRVLDVTGSPSEVLSRIRLLASEVRALKGRASQVLIA